MPPGTLAPAGRTPVRRSHHRPQSPTCTAQRHGTEAAYSYYDCRCPTAREAWRLYRKRRREGRAHPRVVDPTGTRRRLQALAAIGWSPHLLARELGFTATNAVRHLMHTRHGKINTRTAEAVRHLYDKLSMTPGPSTRARNHARRAGWAPPLAWDDHDLDNPHAQPAHTPASDRRTGYDHAVVELACAGRRPAGLRLTQPEREEAVRRLHRAGLNDQQISRRLGITDRSIHRIRRRLQLPTGGIR